MAYTQIVTISTDDYHTLQEFRVSVGAQWTFLADPERTVQKGLDIAEYTDPEHNPMSRLGFERPRTPRGLERRLLIGLPWMEQRCKEA